MVMTIATIAIVAAVDADSDERNANATIKKGDHVATDKRGKHRKVDNRQATTSKKTWAQRNKRRCTKKSGCDDHERRLRNKAHAIDNRWMSSNNESRDNNKKMVASEEEKSEDNNKHDNFAVAMAPPAKKQKRPVASFLESRARSSSPTTTLMPFSPRRRVSWATVATTLWPSDAPRQQKRSLVKN